MWPGTNKGYSVACTDTYMPSDTGTTTRNMSKTVGGSTLQDRNVAVHLL